MDPDTGEILPPGRQGEVCCRGYSVMKGYYNMPEATARAIDSDGWLHSGDLGVMDEEGYVHLSTEPGMGYRINWAYIEENRV